MVAMLPGVRSAKRCEQCNDAMHSEPRARASNVKDEGGGEGETSEGRPLGLHGLGGIRVGKGRTV